MGGLFICVGDVLYDRSGRLIFFHNGNREEQNDRGFMTNNRMKAAVSIDLLGMLLWGATVVHASVSYCSGRRVAKRGKWLDLEEEAREHFDQPGIVEVESTVENVDLEKGKAEKADESSRKHLDLDGSKVGFLNNTDPIEDDAPPRYEG